MQEGRIRFFRNKSGPEGRAGSPLPAAARTECAPYLKRIGRRTWRERNAYEKLGTTIATMNNSTTTIIRIITT